MKSEFKKASTGSIITPNFKIFCFSPIVWKKEGKQLETTEQRKTSRYSVEKKASTQNQTIIQLEIMDADVEDKVGG